MAVAQIAFLVAASAMAMVPWRRLPVWVGPTALAVIAVAARVVPFGDVRSAGHDMANAIAFLLLAVPLAVLLDETGFFSSLAAMFDRGRHLRSGLWLLAALVTIVFNLDAAVVLLTPLYVRIAQRRNADPIVLAFIPALLASLASSVLPVSNLTNLIAVERLDLGDGNIRRPSRAAVLRGDRRRRLRCSRSSLATPTDDVVAIDEPVDRSALRIGFPVVVGCCSGSRVGERLGIHAWVIAAVALVWLCVVRRSVPWRHVPYGAAFLAIALGVLATAAADHIDVERLLAIPGLPGEVGDDRA